MREPDDLRSIFRASLPYFLKWPVLVPLMAPPHLFFVIFSCHVFEMFLLMTAIVLVFALLSCTVSFVSDILLSLARARADSFQASIDSRRTSVHRYKSTDFSSYV